MSFFLEKAVITAQNRNSVIRPTTSSLLIDRLVRVHADFGTPLGNDGDAQYDRIATIANGKCFDASPAARKTGAGATGQCLCGIGLNRVDTRYRPAPSPPDEPFEPLPVERVPPLAAPLKLALVEGFGVAASLKLVVVEGFGVAASLKLVVVEGLGVASLMLVLDAGFECTTGAGVDADPPGDGPRIPGCGKS